MRVELSVTGMTCNNCVKHVERALASVPGVEKVTVSLDKREADIDTKDANIDALIAAVVDAGYEAKRR